MRGDSRQNISRAIEIKNVTIAPDKVKYKTVLSYTYSTESRQCLGLCCINCMNELVQKLHT